MDSSTASPNSATPQGQPEMHIKSEETIGETVAAVAEHAVEDGIVHNDGLADNEIDALKGLTEDVRNQDDLERDITNQANLLMIEQEDERDRKRIEKVNSNVEKLEGQLRTQRRRLNNVVNNPLMHGRCQSEIERLHADIVIYRRK